MNKVEISIRVPDYSNGQYTTIDFLVTKGADDYVLSPVYKENEIIREEIPEHISFDKNFRAKNQTHQFWVSLLENYMRVRNLKLNELHQ